MNEIINKDLKLIANSLGNDLNKFNNKNILLAGGGGFLGYYFKSFFNYIAKKENIKFNLYLLDNFVSSSGNYENDANESRNITYLNLDICDDNVLKFEIKFDFIIHAAGIASPFYYRKKPLETLNVSIDGSKNLLELAKKDKSKYTFFSSSEIYGDPFNSYVPIDESYRGNVSTLGPRACYDEGKRTGETICYIYQNYHNVHTNIIRPFNIYGPGMKKNDYRVMANFADNIINDRPIKVYGDGNQTRTFCYISDGIEGFLRTILFGKAGEAYNIGTDMPEISMNQLAKLFFKIENKPEKIEIIDYPDSYPADEPNRRCPKTIKAKKDLNFEAKISLEEGISNYLYWCKKKF